MTRSSWPGHETRVPWCPMDSVCWWSRQQRRFWYGKVFGPKPVWRGHDCWSYSTPIDLTPCQPALQRPQLPHTSWRRRGHVVRLSTAANADLHHAQYASAVVYRLYRRPACHRRDSGYGCRPQSVVSIALRGPVRTGGQSRLVPGAGYHIRHACQLAIMCPA